jgi:hypothetical protein
VDIAVVSKLEHVLLVNLEVLASHSVAQVRFCGIGTRGLYAAGAEGIEEAVFALGRV